MPTEIQIRGARENNLKNIDLDLPIGKVIVFTGLSGSGKTSCALDVLHAMAQWLYFKNIATYPYNALRKPNVDSIRGLSPSIAIDQKQSARNPRSTVATVTDIYDYLRVLFARVGAPYSPVTGMPLQRQSVKDIAQQIIASAPGQEVTLVSVVGHGKKGDRRKEIITIRRSGFKFIRINGEKHTFDTIPLLDRNREYRIEAVSEPIIVSDGSFDLLCKKVREGFSVSNGVVQAEFTNSDNVQCCIPFTERFICPVSGLAIPEIEPRIFSFNSPYGACVQCDGLGVEHFFSPELIVPNSKLSLVEDAIMPWSSEHNKNLSLSSKRQIQQSLVKLAAHYGFDLNQPFSTLSPEHREVIMEGHADVLFFQGVIPYLKEQLKHGDNGYIADTLRRYQATKLCSQCSGYRLRPESLAIKVGGKHIGEVTAMSISQSFEWFSNGLLNTLCETDQQVSRLIVTEIIARLQCLEEMGLGYLPLHRQSSTLSGGEYQRVKLGSQINDGLSGMVCVLDEPTVGLHPRDNIMLLKKIEELKQLGNTVIAIEHDEETMLAADYLVDMGAGAGGKGGEVIAAGTPAEVAANPRSLTGQYLSGKRFIEVPEKRRTALNGRYVEVVGAKGHNLRNVSAKIPVGALVVITGVSGSGKSTFAVDTLYNAACKYFNHSHDDIAPHDHVSGLEYFDSVLRVDQSAIGRTPRSNPATYINIFTGIREWFANLPEAKARGYNSARFSFNIKGGRCEVCEGDGVLKIDMHFLPDMAVQCEECRGKRYNSETLEIRYNGCSIADVLEMTVDDALTFFQDMPQISEKLLKLQEVGLGYIRLGQTATTFSGGEAQRIKLAKELSKKSTGRTLYIIDEPTSGLHIEDIRLFLQVIKQLVTSGNTILIIEHNLHVIKSADYVIDFGPKGGEEGGTIVAEGTPEQIVQNPNSITGKYLAPHLNDGHSNNK